MLRSSIRNYRLTIRFAKALFVIAFVGLLFAVIAPLLIKTYSVNPIAKKNKISVSSVDLMQNTAQNPRFYGTDAKNQSYTIQAKTAVQLGDKSLELNQVFASYILEDSKLVSIVGDKANLSESSGQVNIIGNAVIMYDDLYSLSSQTALLRYKDGLASGTSQVELISEFGKVESSDFEIKDNYNDIKFFGGRVKTTLYPKDIKNEIR